MPENSSEYCLASSGSCAATIACTAAGSNHDRCTGPCASASNRRTAGMAAAVLPRASQVNKQPRLWLVAELGCLPVRRLRLVELASDAQHIALLGEGSSGRCNRPLRLVPALGEGEFGKCLVVGAS